MNIYLLGFMGCGKTTTGQCLAAALNLPFIDLDTLISEKENATITSIFQEKGETYFRKIEHDILKEITLKKQGSIIALGGGTPCFYDNMDLVNNTGISIYLKASEKILFERLADEKITRPLIANLNDTELIHFISKQLKTREAFYLKSAHLIDTLNLNPKELSVLIKKVISNN